MTDPKAFTFKFFIPDARVLGGKEIENLPEEKKRFAGADGRDGIWVEIACPDGSCLDAEGKITLPVEHREGEKGVFLNLFCPEGSCEITQSTDLP